MSPIVTLRHFPAAMKFGRYRGITDSGQPNDLCRFMGSQPSGSVHRSAPALVRRQTCFINPTLMFRSLWKERGRTAIARYQGISRSAQGETS